MKKVIFIFFAIILVSCGSPVQNKKEWKTQQDAENEFIASLTSSDTTNVLHLADSCMTLLKDGLLQDAVDMIYVLYNGVLYKKNSSYTESLINQFKALPVVSYGLNYYSFSTQGNNDISFYIFSSEESSYSMKLMFNPVFIDGRWYLTFKDGYQSSKELPDELQIHKLAPAPKEIRLNTRPSE